MPSLGEKLRLERESRGIPLDEIAAETRINLRFLEALEKGELSDLPGGAFNKGFVRSYASYLGLEPEPLVREYAEEEHTATEVGRLPQRPDVLDEMREQLGRSDPDATEVLVRNAVRIGVPLVVIAALAALGWWVILPMLSDWSARRAAETPAGQTAMIGGPGPGPAESGGPAATAPSARGSDPAATDDAASASSHGDDVAGGDDAAAGLAADDEAAAPDQPADDPPAENLSASNDEPAPADDPTGTTTGARETASRTEPPPPVADPEPRREERAPPAPPERIATIETSDPQADDAPRSQTATASSTAAEIAPRLDVAEWGVGMGIERRELIGRAARFDEGDTIFFWTRITGGQPGDEIRHVWLRDGRPVGMIPLNINGSHWRTHSRFTLPLNAGTSRWSVEARAKDGTVLAREEFTVGG